MLEVKGEGVRFITSKFLYSSMRQDALSIQTEKTTQHGFFPDGENFLVNP